MSLGWAKNIYIYIYIIFIAEHLSCTPELPIADITTNSKTVTNQITSQNIVHTLTCMLALQAASSPTLALGSTCMLSVFSLLVNASALCSVTCFLRRISIVSRHCSTILMSSPGAPGRQREVVTSVSSLKWVHFDR